MRLLIIFLILAVAIGLFLIPPKPSSHESLSFRKEIIHKDFIAEGVAIADINQDGKKDLVAGAYWFESPNWDQHEFRSPKQFDVNTGWSDAFFSFSMDVDLDGWEDIIQIGTPGDPAYWYQNPQNKGGYWKRFTIAENVCNESPFLQDLDDDGRMDLVFANDNSGEMLWFEPPTKGKELIWTKHVISQSEAKGTKRYSHGLGLGDINGDGRKDIIIRHGWWEAPEDRKELPWTFHAADLGEPCSQMYALDLDRDGDNDIFSASAHAFGIWWHEQVNENGKIAFRRHLIDSTFSQTHSVSMSDIDNDGQAEFITGKRYFAHNGKDPGGLMPAVLYRITFRPGTEGAPTWILDKIDDDSGVGLHTVVEDIDGDGKLDIVNANKKGLISFYLD